MVFVSMSMDGHWNLTMTVTKSRCVAIFHILFIARAVNLDRGGRHERNAHSFGHLFLSHVHSKLSYLQDSWRDLLTGTLRRPSTVWIPWGDARPKSHECLLTKQCRGFSARNLVTNPFIMSKKKWLLPIEVQMYQTHFWQELWRSQRLRGMRTTQVEKATYSVCVSFSRWNDRTRRSSSLLNKHLEWTWAEGETDRVGRIRQMDWHTIISSPIKQHCEVCLPCPAVT